MGRRRIEHSQIRNLQKIGGTSVGVTIPIDIIRRLKWRERQKVVVSEKSGKIIIEDWN